MKPVSLVAAFVLALIGAASAHAYGHGNIISAKADGRYSGHVTVSWQLDALPRFADDVYSVVYLWIGPPTVFLPLDKPPKVGNAYRITTEATLATNSFTTPDVYGIGSYAVSILVNDTFHSDRQWGGCSASSSSHGAWLCSFNDWSYPAAFRIDGPKVCHKVLVTKGHFTRGVVAGHTVRTWHKPVYRTSCR
jgi:hypothetical protein